MNKTDKIFLGEMALQLLDLTRQKQRYDACQNKACFEYDIKKFAALLQNEPKEAASALISKIAMLSAAERTSERSSERTVIELRILGG